MADFTKRRFHFAKPLFCYANGRAGCIFVAFFLVPSLPVLLKKHPVFIWNIMSFFPFYRVSILPSLFFITSIALIFSACAPMEQLQQVATTDPAVKQEGAFTYENDTLKVTYSFWAERGVLSYEVMNKSNKPLYIDWKKSSFIVNDLKLDCFQEDVLVYESPQYQEYLYLDQIQNNPSGQNYPVFNVYKQERITFIPPQSKYARYQFHISPDRIKQADQDSGQFEAATSPVRFRNYLTYSQSEQFSEAKAVDNSFYISKFKNMRHSRLPKPDPTQLHIQYFGASPHTTKFPAHVISGGFGQNQMGFVQNNLFSIGSYEFAWNKMGLMLATDRVASGGDMTYNMNSWHENSRIQWNTWLGYRKYFSIGKYERFLPFLGAQIGQVNGTGHNKFTSTQTQPAILNDTLLTRRVLYAGLQGGLQYTAFNRISLQWVVQANAGPEKQRSQATNAGVTMPATETTDKARWLQSYVAIGFRL